MKKFKKGDLVRIKGSTLLGIVLDEVIGDHNLRRRWARGYRVYCNHYNSTFWDFELDLLANA